MDVFEMKTGKFTPLSDAQLATLNDEQRSAYDALVAAAAQLDAAKAEVENSIVTNRAAVESLHAAEALQAKQPTYSRLDATRDAIAQYRKDHP